jgi:hypothetical protein
VPIVQAFWQPRVRLRADQSDPDGACVAGTIMKGDVQVLNLHTLLANEVVSKSSSTMTHASLDVGVPLVASAGVSVPVQVSSESGSVDMTLVDNQHGARQITAGTATYTGTAWVAAYANRGLWDSSAESEAWVWDSKPGLEFEGFCQTPCAGRVTLHYGW